MPLSAKDRQKIVKEIKEIIKPFVTEQTNNMCNTLMDPLRRNVRKLESDNLIFEKRVIARVDREVKETIDLFAAEIDLLKKNFEANMRSMQKHRARDKTENDIKHNKTTSVFTN